MEVDLLRDTKLVRVSLPTGPEDAVGVRLVDEERGAVALLQLDDLRERRDVAAHAEHGLGHDQLPPRARLLGAPQHRL